MAHIEKRTAKPTKPNGMTPTDGVQYLGSQSRVSEILNRKRPLTLTMVKSLYRNLKIPAEVLLG